VSVRETLAATIGCVFYVTIVAPIVMGAAKNAAETEVASDASAQLGSVVQTIQQNIQPRLREAISQPSAPRTIETAEDTKSTIARLRLIAQPPALDFVSNANRYRMIAFLEVMLARLESERIAYMSGPPGINPTQEFLNYARFSLDDIAKARHEAQKAEDPDSKVDPELLQWMKREDILGHLLHLEAHAHAMIWVATGQKSERAAARTAWAAAAQTPFGKKNMQPSPELANALDLYPWYADPHLIMTLLWVGVGLIAAGVVIALFVPHPSSFQMFVFRIVASLGAAGIGASLPGFIGFKTPAVTAGGAVALFVLIYLVNPPRLARNLAGNPNP
jgi:hypothetical protein